MSAHFFQFFLTSNGNPFPHYSAISYTPTIFIVFTKFTKISLVSTHKDIMKAHKIFMSAHKVLLSAHAPSNEAIFFLHNVSKIHFYNRVHLLHCLKILFCFTMSTHKK